MPCCPASFGSLLNYHFMGENTVNTWKKFATISQSLGTHHT